MPEVHRRPWPGADGKCDEYEIGARGMACWVTVLAGDNGNEPYVSWRDGRYRSLADAERMIAELQQALRVARAHERRTYVCEGVIQCEHPVGKEYAPGTVVNFNLGGPGYRVAGRHRILRAELRAERPGGWRLWRYEIEPVAAAVAQGEGVA